MGWTSHWIIATKLIFHSVTEKSSSLTAFSLLILQFPSRKASAWVTPSFISVLFQCLRFSHQSSNFLPENRSFVQGSSLICPHADYQHQTTRLESQWASVRNSRTHELTNSRTGELKNWRADELTNSRTHQLTSLRTQEHTNSRNSQLTIKN